MVRLCLDRQYTTSRCSPVAGNAMCVEYTYAFCCTSLTETILGNGVLEGGSDGGGAISSERGRGSGALWASGDGDSGRLEIFCYSRLGKKVSGRMPNPVPVIPTVLPCPDSGLPEQYNGC